MSQREQSDKRDAFQAAADSQLAHTATLIDRLISNHGPIDCGGDGTREALIRARDFLRRSIPSSTACSKCGKTPPFPGGTRCQDLQCPLINWAVSRRKDALAGISFYLATYDDAPDHSIGVTERIARAMALWDEHASDDIGQSSG